MTNKITGMVPSLFIAAEVGVCIIIAEGGACTKYCTVPVHHQPSQAFPFFTAQTRITTVMVLFNSQKRHLGIYIGHQSISIQFKSTGIFSTH